MPAQGESCYSLLSNPDIDKVVFNATTHARPHRKDQRSWNHWHAEWSCQTCRTLDSPTFVRPDRGRVLCRNRIGSIDYRKMYKGDRRPTTVAIRHPTGQTAEAGRRDSQPATS